MRGISFLHVIFFFVDTGFVIYWLITAIGVIPAEYLYSDYSNPILVSWNWSFFPLDMLVSATGLGSIYAYRRSHRLWRSLTLISLVLTVCSGLQAVSYWLFHGDFDWQWWLPNLFLLLYPLWFIYALMRDFNTVSNEG